MAERIARETRQSMARQSYQASNKSVSDILSGLLDGDFLTPFLEDVTDDDVRDAKNRDAGSSSQASGKTESSSENGTEGLSGLGFDFSITPKENAKSHSTGQHVVAVSNDTGDMSVQSSHNSEPKPVPALASDFIALKTEDDDVPPSKLGQPDPLLQALQHQTVDDMVKECQDIGIINEQGERDADYDDAIASILSPDGSDADHSHSGDEAAYDVSEEADDDDVSEGEPAYSSDTDDGYLDDKTDAESEDAIDEDTYPSDDEDTEEDAKTSTEDVDSPDDDGGYDSDFSTDSTDTDEEDDWADEDGSYGFPVLEDDGHTDGDDEDRANADSVDDELEYEAPDDVERTDSDEADDQADVWDDDVETEASDEDASVFSISDDDDADADVTADDNSIPVPQDDGYTDFADDSNGHGWSWDDVPNDEGEQDASSFGELADGLGGMMMPQPVASDTEDVPDDGGDDKREDAWDDGNQDVPDDGITEDADETNTDSSTKDSEEAADADDADDADSTILDDGEDILDDDAEDEDDDEESSNEETTSPASSDKTRQPVNMKSIYDMTAPEETTFPDLKPAPASFEGFCPIEPVPKGRPRFNSRSGTAYTPAKTRKYESAVRSWAMSEYGDDVAPMDGPLSVRYEFLLPKPKSVTRKTWYSHRKPDIDNLVKSFQDALDFESKWYDGTIMGVMANDSRFSVMSATKRYARDGERCGTYVSIHRAGIKALVVMDGVPDALLDMADPTMMRFHVSELRALRKAANTQAKSQMFDMVKTVYLMMGDMRGDGVPSDVQALIDGAFTKADNVYVL